MLSEDEALLRYAPKLARFTKEHDDVERTLIVWVLGPLGAVSLVMFRPPLPDDWDFERCFGTVDRHSPRPLYDGETPHAPCQYLEGQCYCDGSALLGMEMAKQWASGDEEGVWAMLEVLYVSWLNIEQDRPPSGGE